MAVAILLTATVASGCSQDSTEPECDAEDAVKQAIREYSYRVDIMWPVLPNHAELSAIQLDMQQPGALLNISIPAPTRKESVWICTPASAASLTTMCDGGKRVPLPNGQKYQVRSIGDSHQPFDWSPSPEQMFHQFSGAGYSPFLSAVVNQDDGPGIGMPVQRDGLPPGQLFIIDTCYWRPQNWPE